VRAATGFRAHGDAEQAENVLFSSVEGAEEVRNAQIALALLAREREALNLALLIFGVEHDEIVAL